MLFYFAISVKREFTAISLIPQSHYNEPAVHKTLNILWSLRDELRRILLVFTFLFLYLLFFVTILAQVEPSIMVEPERKYDISGGNIHGKMQSDN